MHKLTVVKGAPRGDRARIEKLLAWAEARIRRAFRRFLDEIQSAAVRRQVRAALERDGVEAALRVVDAHIARMSAVLFDVFQEAGRSEVAALAGKIRMAGARVAVSFDPTHPHAADLMRRNRLEFVREMTRAQREATRAALVDALRTGAGPAKTASAFYESIGLTEAQRRAVRNYRGLLEASDAAALSRDLRDRRFDPSVRRAAESGEPLGADKIDRMVAGYRDRYLRYRAETIARTETTRVVGQARLEATSQVVEDVGIPRELVVRTWAASLDNRTRDSHEMMNGQQRGLAEPYDSPYGARFMFPGDASLGAPAEELVNCRCTEYIEIRPDESQ